MLEDSTTDWEEEEARIADVNRETRERLENIYGVLYVDITVINKSGVNVAQATVVFKDDSNRADVIRILSVSQKRDLSNFTNGTFQNTGLPSLTLDLSTDLVGELYDVSYTGREFLLIAAFLGGRDLSEVQDPGPVDMALIAKYGGADTFGIYLLGSLQESVIDVDVVKSPQDES